MNNETLKGQWKQIKGKVQAQWGKLTQDDLEVVNGEKHQLVGKIQERYGIEKKEAEKQVTDFETKHFTASTHTQQTR